MDCGCDAKGKELSNEQLLALLQKSPVLDEVVKPLPQALQAKLLILQQQAGNTFAAGNWSVGDQGETLAVPERSPRPTVEQAQEVLGEAYLALDAKRNQLKEVMDAMALTPSSQKGWIGKIVDNVAGIFR